MSPSPMLRAAMIAVGGQYSNDANAKRKSRMLHDRCIKLLERREQEPMAEADRLCDHQAVFLVEVLSQYRARRAAKTLSHRFGTLYHKAAEDFRHTTTQISDMVASLTSCENVTWPRWSQWIELSTWQRLLVSCYMLESQQAMWLAREPLPSVIRESGIDLPFPTHTLVWDAATLNDWATAAQQHSSSPQYVFDVTPGSASPSCDSFQSSLLIAAYYNRFNASTPYSNTPIVEEIDHVLDASFATKQKLLTAKLLQVTPLRALLAVSGESWILSEKVSSPQAFGLLKTTLRTWVMQLWSASGSESQHAPVKEAIRLSIQMLQLALDTPSKGLVLDMGADMGLYFAALVLWAATTAASTRTTAPQQAAPHVPHRHHSQSPGFVNHHGSMPVPSTPTLLLNSITTHSSITSSPIQANALGFVRSQPTSPARQESLATAPLLSHEQIAFNSVSFLTVVLGLMSATPASQHLPDPAGMQVGCISMLLWVKLQLRGASLEEQSATDVWASRPGEGLGELLDSVAGSLERLLNRGWAGWGI